MRTVTRSTGHSWQGALNVGQTLTIKANPDRTALSMLQIGTKTTLSVTVGSGVPITLAASANESLGTFLGNSGIALTTEIKITTDTNTTIAAVLSDPNNISVA